MEDTENNFEELENENEEFDEDFEDYGDEDDYYEDEGNDNNYSGNDDLDDQRTWGQKRGICDTADNCYGCSNADQCF